MNSNAILSSDVLDILFDNRNKSYGAYTLRKFYPNRVKTSLFIMLSFATVFSAFTFLPASKGQLDRPLVDDTILTTLYEEKKEIEKPKEQPLQQPKPKQTQHLTDKLLIVKDDKPSTVFNDIENLAVSTATDTSILPEGPESVFKAGGPGTAEVIPVPEAEPDINIPIENPDVPPSYPGGLLALRNFLERNLRAPDELSEAVQVRVKFVVDNEGHLESFDIVQDGGEEFNKEVIRVLKKMPQWTPGKKGGRSIKAYCYLPVKFAPTE
jgi:periplasmic protein TonB